MLRIITERPGSFWAAVVASATVAAADFIASTHAAALSTEPTIGDLLHIFRCNLGQWGCVRRRRTEGWCKSESEQERADERERWRETESERGSACEGGGREIVRASKGEKKSQRGGGQDKTREQVREKQASGTAESERASEIQKERDNAEHPSSQLVML